MNAAQMSLRPMFAPCMRRIRPSASGAASQRARELAAEGKNIMSLTLGEPDFDTPPHVQEAAIRAIQVGATRYTTVDGTPELKSAICHKFERENGLHYGQNQITVSSGAKQVIFNAMMTTLRPGDEVLIPAPYWVSYPEVVKFTGAKAIIIRTDAERGFKLTAEQLSDAMGQRTRWLILNSPSNPSGATYAREELKALAAVLSGHEHVWILTDDIYEHITFDGVEFCTMASAAPELHHRTLTVNGVSKAYSMTGWRIGYAGGPAPLIAQMATLQSQATSCPCSISQAAAFAALEGPQGLVREHTRVFQERRDLLVSALNSIEGLACRSPQGAFYAYPSCRGLLGKRTPDGKQLRCDGDFASYLLDNAGIAVVDGGAYGLSPYIRLSFALPAAQLQEACERIRVACDALQ